MTKIFKKIGGFFFSQEIWFFFDKNDINFFVNLILSLTENNNVLYGIYEFEDKSINKKIDTWQKAFGKKKEISSFKKKAIKEYIIKDYEKIYLDFIHLNEIKDIEYIFNFLFEDFFYERNLIKIVKQDSDVIDISKKISYENYIEYKKDTIINCLFGYTHNGKKVLVFDNSIKDLFQGFNTNISSEEFNLINKNSVVFMPFKK